MTPRELMAVMQHQGGDAAPPCLRRPFLRPAALPIEAMRRFPPPGSTVRRSPALWRAPHAEKREIKPKSNFCLFGSEPRANPVRLEAGVTPVEGFFYWGAPLWAHVPRV